MKFYNVITPLGIEVCLGSAEPYPVLPMLSQQTRSAIQRQLMRFGKEGPPQWIAQKIMEASTKWLEMEGFEELKDNPNYEWVSVESITGNMVSLDECLPKESTNESV